MAKIEQRVVHGPASNPLQGPIDEAQLQKVNHPAQYNLGASECTRMALRMLGITHYDSECIEAIERGYPWLLRNSYAFTAVVYLWRCEHKRDLPRDLEKALWYLNRGIDYSQVYSLRKSETAEVEMMIACRAEVEKLIKELP